MTFRIPAGKHRARPLRFRFWWRKNSFAWLVKFTDSCRYDLGNTDQYDINKLIGIGYLPGHHKESARFGWRYDTVKGMIEIMAYCYVNGQRVIKSICFCEIGKEYRLRLQVLAMAYYFDVYEPSSVTAAGIVTVERNHRKHFKYRLGVWFGGNQVATHDMEIELTKV
jgi:hypothetical protein